MPLARNQSPKEIIEARSRGAIEHAIHADERDLHVGAGAKRLAAQATTEYHNRFLIELIQNGHDAHPPDDTQGELHVLFDHDDGDFGVLYVANRGVPFSPSNFRTICELGLSDKVPGEAIGNKGLGFKSVLQICSRPEIFSRTQGTSKADTFGGFCFSFANDAELRELVDGNEDVFLVVRRETAMRNLSTTMGHSTGLIREQCPVW